MSLLVRDATPADYEVFARLFPELRVPDPVLTQAQFEERMLPNTIIATGGEPVETVGYANWRLYGTTAHVVHVVVDPRAWRRGVGRLMMEEIRRRVVARGATRWYLFVKADNEPAIRLYQHVGLALERRGWPTVANWSALKTLECSVGTSTFEPTLEEASRFARDHGVDPERLAIFWARAGAVFVALRDDAGICALATFDPAFPSICPILVTRPEYARPLFDLFFPHAQHPHVHLCVDDAALADALFKCGAKLEYETLRMGAPLG
jgi:GNAT superfamily N-acetyltransferase